MNHSASIISSLIIFLFPYIGKYWFNRQILTSTVVSLGLLGTFGGIFYGLLDFNVNDIEDSLPQLLEGLKTAFLTSIAGMASSLILKLSPILYGIKIEKDNSHQEQVETNHLFELLTAIEKNTAEKIPNLSQIQSSNINSEELHEALKNMNSFIQHLQQTQENSTERMTQVLQELQTILKSINENNSKIETYLHKSYSLNVNQQEHITTQMTNLGNMVKTTETQFEHQLIQMEEKFTRELSANEQFTKTLLAIIKKLTQDHIALNKSPETDLSELN